MTRGDSQPVEIIGGGLAGLALGLALQRRGVPVMVFEAHDYPLEPRRQRWLVLASRTGLLPFRLLYHLTH
jgi:2-polyprenyl-6-methoxyphenol hydroxylase-like FAD-dependent oxidoreductase